MKKPHPDGPIYPSCVITLPIICLLTGILAFGHATEQPGPSEQRLTEGIKLVVDGKFTEAIAFWGQLKQENPKDPQPYFFSGIALTELGRLSAAASELSEAVRLSPGKLEYQVFHADVLARLNHKDLAIKSLIAFQQINVVAQLSTELQLRLAELYYRIDRDWNFGSGHYDDALRVARFTSKKAPNDPRPDAILGRIYAAKGKLDIAQRHFELSIRRKAVGNAEAYFELGKILYQRNEIVSAKKVLSQAVSQDPSNVAYLHKLGAVCLALNQVEESLNYLKRAEPAGHMYPEIYYSLARAYGKQKERERAAEYSTKFQEISSAKRMREDQKLESEKRIRLGESAMDAGNNTEALSLFEEAVQIDPLSWDARGYLAEMFLSAGKLEAAYGHLAKMEEIDPESTVGNYLMASYHYQHGELERARVYAERVKASLPANSKLRNLLGNIYIGLGRRQQAIDEYEAAVNLSPDRDDYRWNLRTAKESPTTSK